MKIAYVIPILGGGGAEVLLGAICEELSNKGHEVKIICLHSHHSTFKNFPNREFIEKNIQPIIISSKVIFSFLRKTTIDNEEYKKIIEEFKPDIIHSHLYEADLISYSYLSKEVKYFSHVHDNIIQLEKLKLKTFVQKSKITNLFESYWLKKRYKLAKTNFITISQDTFFYLNKNLSSFFQKNIYLLKNAINLDNFCCGNKSSTIFNIVSVGNLVPKKDHLLLIEIANFLRQKDIPFKIKILGYGDLHSFLSDKISFYNLENNVELLGNVKNVNDYLSTAHIYVHTANYEPFGLAIIEAMASSLPVISIDGKGNTDLIQDGINGFMIFERNPSLMAEKIELLYKNEVLRIKMGENALKFSKQFSISEYVDKLLVLYQNK